VDVAVDVPSDDSAAAFAAPPDDAVDVAITLPDAYASLLDVAVAHLFAIAHASTLVAVAVLPYGEDAQVELAGIWYVCHPIVAESPYLTSASGGARGPR